MRPIKLVVGVFASALALIACGGGGEAGGSQANDLNHGSSKILGQGFGEGGERADDDDGHAPGFGHGAPRDEGAGGGPRFGGGHGEDCPLSHGGGGGHASGGSGGISEVGGAPAAAPR